MGGFKRTDLPFCIKDGICVYGGVKGCVRCKRKPSTNPDPDRGLAERATTTLEHDPGLCGELGWRHTVRNLVERFIGLLNQRDKQATLVEVALDFQSYYLWGGYDARHYMDLKDRLQKAVAAAGMTVEPYDPMEERRD